MLCVSEPNAPKSALVPSATPKSPHHAACQTPKVLHFISEEGFYIQIVTAIIHVVGPTVAGRQVKDEHREALGSCYQRALYEAVSAGLRSIVLSNSVEALHSAITGIPMHFYRDLRVPKRGRCGCRRTRSARVASGVRKRTSCKTKTVYTIQALALSLDGQNCLLHARGQGLVHLSRTSSALLPRLHRAVTLPRRFFLSHVRCLNVLPCSPFV